MDKNSHCCCCVPSGSRTATLMQAMDRMERGYRDEIAGLKREAESLRSQRHTLDESLSRKHARYVDALRRAILAESKLREIREALG